MHIKPLLTVAVVGTLLSVLALSPLKRTATAQSESDGTEGKEVPKNRLRKLPRIPAELKPVLIALRRGKTLEANTLVWNHVGLLKTWLSEVLVKGQTTRGDILALLGPALKDLDRPKRDAVVTAQYQLGSHTAFTTLVFDFDAKTGVLTDWSTSQAICGFCPHVFADDGRWRLEGKLLAGCIGRDRESRDTLVLPRLVERNGRVQVKVSNLAPETEYADQVLLGMVPLDDGEELDVDSDGRPVAWRSTRELPVTRESADGPFAASTFDLDHRSPGGLIVLEVRNTSDFESAMRGFFLEKGDEPSFTKIQIQFDGGPPIRIAPVGTKFLRRVAVCIPVGAKQLQLRFRDEMWLVRRMWIGTGRTVDSAIEWQTPVAVHGPTAGALDLISAVDGQRLTLEPQDEFEFGFRPPDRRAETARFGYVLRMTGYYEFQTQSDRDN